MNKREPIKSRQERGVVRQFLEWVNRRDGTGWEVESRPEPPEAIIRDGSRRCWVEVTSGL